MGVKSYAWAKEAVAIGNNAEAMQNGSVALGSGSIANEANVVSVGSPNLARRIVNVADGTSANDAATYGQLSAVSAKVDSSAAAISSLTSNVNTLKDNIAVNAQNIAQNTTNIAKNTASINTLKIETSALRVDVDTNGRHIVENRNTIAANAAEIGKIGAVLGTDYANPAFSTLRVGGMSYAGSTLSMGGGRITGLAPGRISADSTDAVTGSQLYQVHRGMGELQESVKIVGAHAAALSGLHPIQYDPGAPTTLSAAFGTYRDEYALALGVFHYARENVMFNLGASLNTDGEVMGRAGISIALGKSSPKLDTKNMDDMQRQMAQMQAMLIELKAQNDRNERTIAQLTSQLSSK